MRVYRSAREVAGEFALTLGNFDGVHIGHQAVLRALNQVARDRGLASLAMTFEPHPVVVHNPNHAPALITGLEEKLDRLERTGIDAVLVQPYSLEFAQLTPKEFISQFLSEQLGVKAIVVGHDVRFGKDNAGDLTTFQTLGPRFGIETVIAIDDLGLGEDLGRVSSSHIRQLLANGRVGAAAQVLGALHCVTGIVVHGNARGRLMGFPTANLGGEVSGLIPADGVYAGWVYFADGIKRPGAISVGTNPTFNGSERRVEVNVVGVDFPDLDVYGQAMRVEFLTHIRRQVAFTDMEALRKQIGVDVENIREALGMD